MTELVTAETLEEAVMGEAPAPEPENVVQTVTFEFKSPGAADGSISFTGQAPSAMQMFALADFLRHEADFALAQMKAARMQQAFAEAQARQQVVEAMQQHRPIAGLGGRNGRG
jgi:hypothetical protein